jgi:hypothetical protein
MIQDLRVTIGQHYRTFINKKKVPQVVNRETKRDMHRRSLSSLLPHYAALQSKLPLGHHHRRAAV